MNVPCTQAHEVQPSSAESGGAGAGRLGVSRPERVLASKDWRRAIRLSQDPSADLSRKCLFFFNSFFVLSLAAFFVVLVLLKQPPSSGKSSESDGWLE